MADEVFYERCAWPAPHFNELNTLRWLSLCFSQALPGRITNYYPSDFIGPLPPKNYLLPIKPAYLASEHEGIIQFRLRD